VALDEKNSKTVKRKSADIKVMSFELFSKKIAQSDVARM